MTSDVEKLQEENARLMDLVERDGLTGLYNRKTIEDKINRLLPLYQEGFMIVLDVDKFKLVNDELGHLVGDYVLQNIAKALKEVFRSEDMVGRIGGDEYLVFLPNLSKQEIVIWRMNQINEIMAKLRLQDGRAYSVQVSYGYSRYQKNDTYATVFERADQMLLERSIHRLGKSSNIILLTLSDYQDDFIPLQVRGNHMRSLANAISESLRMNDVYCQYSNCQYLVMAVEADCSDAERIVRRISDNFYDKIKMDSTRSVCLDHTVYPLSAVDEMTNEAMEKII